ncbi:PREDICTED: tomoregulin-1 [Dipodomys ordii]|uniref:Tomoregulin-1 n=1 Tax=Dipodomys ordii TaxID=10020 RepID=A0A1S3FQ59_DIPOR|nr:PREDICTED: tomoregulin-1 [Dipodomys ordii]
MAAEYLREASISGVLPLGMWVEAEHEVQATTMFVEGVRWIRRFGIGSEDKERCLKGLATQNYLLFTARMVDSHTTLDRSVAFRNWAALHPKLNMRESVVRVCDESSCKYGGVCKEDGDGLKCACQFQCHTNYIPVCGSNGDTYQNECFLRRASCKHQKEITVVARGPCYSDNGSGSGEGEEEGSGAEAHRKHSKCGPCKYKAECDEDAENVGCVCNIDCSGYSFNPVCASDGSSYNNPCFVREASCIKQEQIDIRHLGHCTDTDDMSLLGKKDDGLQYSPDVKDASDQREDVYVGSHMPCPENLNGYCIHGKCEFIYSTQKASCRCESGYTGQYCEKTDFSILYVVPSRQKLTHVLIAAIIGAVQIAIIVAIVMCITRKCPKNNRGRRQKQNLGHFTSDTSSRMV